MSQNSDDEVQFPGPPEGTTEQDKRRSEERRQARLFEQPADLDEDTPEKLGRTSVEDRDAAGLQGEAVAGDGDEITPGDDDDGAETVTEVEAYFGRGTTIRDIHSQARQQNAELQAARAENALGLRVLLEAQAATERVKAELVAANAENAELLAAKLDGASTGMDERLAESKRALEGTASALPEGSALEIRDSLGPDLLSAENLRVVEGLEGQPGLPGPKAKLRAGILKAMAGAGITGEKPQFFPAKPVPIGGLGKVRASLTAECAKIVTSKAQLHSDDGEAYLVRMLGKALQNAGMAHLEAAFRAGTTIDEVMDAYNVARDEAEEARKGNQYTDALDCLRQICVQDQELLCDCAAAVGGKMSKTVEAHSRKTAGGSVRTAVDHGQSGWILLLVVVKELVVDQPTHMALELRRILGMMPSLKGRFYGNFHWYVRDVVKELVAFEGKHGLISAELILHSLLLPHMIEGKEPSLVSWRNDLQYHKQLGNVVYSSYSEMKPKIPELVQAITSHQQVTAPGVWEGAPMEKKAYLDSIGAKGGTELVLFASTDGVPTCTKCGKRHAGPGCLETDNLKRVLDEMPAYVRRLKEIEAGLVKANKKTAPAEKGQEIDALVGRFSQTMSGVETVIRNQRKGKSNAKPAARVYTSQDTSAVPPSNEVVLAVETQSKAYLAEFRTRLAADGYDPETCYGWICYPDGCQREACRFKHEKALQGRYSAEAKGTADKRVTRSAAAKGAAPKGGGSKQGETAKKRDVPIPGTKCEKEGCNKLQRKRMLANGQEKVLGFCCDAHFLESVKGTERVGIAMVASEAESSYDSRGHR
jgi:hypothetical protein